VEQDINSLKEGTNFQEQNYRIIAKSQSFQHLEEKVNFERGSKILQSLR